MQITVNELGPCRKKIEIEIPIERVKEEFDKNYGEVASGTQIPGFRRGRVPRAVLRRRFGEKVHERVKASLLQEALGKMFSEHGIDPIAEPDIDLEAVAVAEDTAFSLAMELDVKPDIDLGEYKGIEVEKVVLPLDEAKVDEAIEELRVRHAELSPVDGQAIEASDRLTFDLTLENDGETVLSHENLPVLVVADQVIPTLELAHTDLIGKKVGDVLTGETTIGDDFNDEALRGKTVQYTVTLQSHQRQELPELDEEFLGQFNVDSVEAFRERIRHDLEHRLEHEAESQTEDRILDVLLERAEFDLPEPILEREREQLDRILRMRLTQAGVEPDQLEEKLAEAKAESEDELQQKVRRGLILDAVAKAEHETLAVTEAELEQQIRALASAHRVWPNEMRDRLEKSGQIDDVTADVSMRKARAFLRHHAKLTEPSTDS